MLRALVVDDERSVRDLIATALSKEGFHCDVASDGSDAWERISDAALSYHLVVTDLAIPGENGHALAIKILGMSRRPLVAVLTGILEPKLAKDLIARGVDDFVFKPVQFMLFAAKMRSLTERSLQVAPVASRSSTAPSLSAGDRGILGSVPAHDRVPLLDIVRGL
jgi:DNA-binding response OmpR family regulator